MQILSQFKLRIFFTIALLLTVPASAEDWSISPGAGVGPVKLGMKLSDVEVKTKVLPQGHGPLRRTDTVTEVRNGKMVIAYTRYDGIEVQWLPRAIQIVVNKPSITVNSRPVNLVGPGGLRVGGTLANIQATLGRWDEARDLKPQKNTMMYVYKNKRIGFVVKDGRIASINVWEEDSKK